MKSMLAVRTAEGDLSRAIISAKRERSSLRARAVEADASVTSYKSRLAAALEKYEKQSQQLQALEDAFHREKSQRVVAEQRQQDAEATIRKLKDCMRGCKIAIDEHWMHSQVAQLKVSICYIMNHNVISVLRECLCHLDL